MFLDAENNMCDSKALNVNHCHNSRFIKIYDF